MIPFEEALNIVLSNANTLGTEHITLLQSLNRTLAEDILSDTDIPPFNKAAMDGYACRKADLTNELEVVEEIQAGSVPQKSIGKNQCCRIMTGAMVPEGADFILMKENAQLSKNKVICTVQSNHTNICYLAEDIKNGDIVIKKGITLLPQHIAILSSVGSVNPLVYKQPHIAIISTGNELVEPDQKPGISQIRNSNGFQLYSQVFQLGLSPQYLGIIKDNEASLKKILCDAIEKYDLILVSGGVSVGDYDYVPEVLKQLEVLIKFHGLMAKPGKHLLFGTKNNHYVFGLPGNPVSSFVQFELLVRPLLNLMMGKEHRETFVQIPLEEKFIRKKNNTVDFIPVIITPFNTASLVDYHGSAHIHSYTKANGIMKIPIGTSEFNKGELVYVRPL
jgi:molybdopterin molybdotransferase